MKQRYDEPTHDLCYLATFKLLEHKWTRNDVRTFIEEWTGYSRKELMEDELENGSLRFGLKYEILEELAMSAEDMIVGIIHGVDPEFNPVSLRPRHEPASGKIRNVAYLDLRHQQLGHIVKLGLEKHLTGSLLPTQHASIPGHGQTMLVRQVRRMLNRKLGIKYYQKTDVTAAYASTKYSVVIDLIEKRLPNAKWIHACLRVLERYAPDGHLIIGGYLDAWLFNYVMSYALHYILSLKKTRRNEEIPMVIQAVTYMDDMLLLGSSESSMKQAVSKLTEWMFTAFGVRLRTTTGIIKLSSIEEEKRRKKSVLPSSRHAPMIDMAGFKIGKSHITIRRRNVKRIVRTFDRAWREYQKTGTIKRQRACAIISRNGLLKNSDSFQFCEKHHVYKLMRIAKKNQRYWAKQKRKKRKEFVENVVNKYRKQYEALCGTA